jgi:hypothetical protein
MPTPLPPALEFTGADVTEGDFKTAITNLRTYLDNLLDSTGVAADARAKLGVAGAGVPAGCILMWSGSIVTIPAGWVLCDGNNGTPDLRNRFVVAAGGDYAVGATGNGSVPSHTHGAGSFAAASGGAHTHTQRGCTIGTAGTGSTGMDGRGNVANDGNAGATASGGAHTHTVSGTSAAAGTGTANVAIHYALAYIMKE